MRKTRLKALPAPKCPAPKPPVLRQPPDDDFEDYNSSWPAGVPKGAGGVAALSISKNCEHSYSHLGLYKGDWVVVWEGAPTSNYDLVALTSFNVNKNGKNNKGHEKVLVGRYHQGPGGYVRLECGGKYVFIYKPSDIVSVARVMHIERKEKIVQRFPLEGGTA